MRSLSLWKSTEVYKIEITGRLNVKAIISKAYQL